MRYRIIATFKDTSRRIPLDIFVDEVGDEGKKVALRKAMELLDSDVYDSIFIECSYNGKRLKDKIIILD